VPSLEAGSLVTDPFDPAGPAQFDGIFGLPHSAEAARVVLLAVPWEPTTSYRKGTAKGPAAILEASRQVDLFDVETGKPYEGGIHLLAADPDVVRWNEEACRLAQPVIDAGGAGDDPELLAALARVNELSTHLDEQVYLAARRWLDLGKIVGLVGGDHASPFGAIRAHAEKYPGLGVLHVDAHADLRVAYEGFTRSHASIMHNVLADLPDVAKLVQVGSAISRRRSTSARAPTRGSPPSSTRLRPPEARGRELRAARRPGHRRPCRSRSTCPSTSTASTRRCAPPPGRPSPAGSRSTRPRTSCAAWWRAAAPSSASISTRSLPTMAATSGDANVGARMLYKLIGWTLRSRATR
jgi:agmatinase